MDTIWPEIFIVESVAIVTGNLLTIVVLSNASSLKKRGNWLIINLAVADLLIGAFSEPLYIATLKGYLKQFAIYTSVDIFLGMASVFGLTALALDRLFAVSRPFQHRTISDKAYAAVIAAIWMIASGISIFSFLAAKNRFLVFFYVVLPLLTVSQLFMIMSYVLIWIIVKSKRLHSSRRRRENAKLNTQREPTKSIPQNQEQETGSVRFSVSEKENSSPLSDYETRSTRDFPGSTSNDTGSVRIPMVLFDSETGSIRDYLGSSVDTGSVINLQNDPCESTLTNIKTDDPRSTSKWKRKFFRRSTMTSDNDFNNCEKQIEGEDMKNDNPKFCIAKICQSESSSSDSAKVINYCTGMIKDLKKTKPRTRKPRTRKQKQTRSKRNSHRAELHDRDNKLAMTLFIATAISLLAWLPFEIMNIIMSLCLPCRVQLYNIHVLSFTKFLHYANSFVNPIIYTFRIQEFRRAINKILRLPLRHRSGDRKTSLEMSGQSSWRNKTSESRGN